jgi:hypothetical protein
LELGLKYTPRTPADPRDLTRKVSFPLELETSLESFMEQLTGDGQMKVPLEPKDSNDPFYAAQVRALELEALPNLDRIPLLNLPFEQEVASRALLGMKARDELNRKIPHGVRETRLAFSASMLTALEHPTLKLFPLEDDELVVTGLFNGFSFDTYNEKDTIVVPLLNPWIREPRLLRGVELASAKIPVLSIDEWKWAVRRKAS